MEIIVAAATMLDTRQTKWAEWFLLQYSDHATSQDIYSFSTIVSALWERTHRMIEELSRS